jgi:exopolysaccharide biosynthesis WecB/TagA/CpsF family protein
MSDTAAEAATPRAEFAGLAFDDLDMRKALDAVHLASRGADWRYVVTPNAAHLARLSNADQDLLDIYARAHLCLLDSRVVALTARLLGRRPPHVVPGADLVEALFHHVIARQTPICIIGGGDTAADHLRARFALTAIDHFNPPMGFWRSDADMARAVDFIVASQADYTFLVVGSPGQELLAAAVARTTRARGVAICAGASIDFLTGVQRRAPVIMRRLALEWAYRLWQEPRRLAYRYFVESPKGVLFALRKA